MISALYILHSVDLHLEYQSSEILLHKVYHDDLYDTQKILADFDSEYKRQLPESRLPFINIKGLNYVYLRSENDLIFLVVTRANIDTMLTIFFLHSFLKLVKHYLCEKTKSKRDIAFDRDVILDNVYFIYELLDECMDIGIIQTTDYNILKEYIKIMPNIPRLRSDDSDEEHIDTEEDHHKSKDKDLKNVKSTHNQAIKTDIIPVEDTFINSSILRASSSSINWRPKGIFYAKNEIFVDMVESCDFYYDLQKDHIIRNEVNGNLHVKCYLSGMPTCTIGFNETKISSIENDEVVPEREGNQLNDVDEGDEGDDQAIVKEKKHIPFRNIQFHQCVQLDSIYHNNLMRFIPPDDTFILMSYQVEQQKQKRKLPLIMIKPTYRIKKQERKLQILVILSTQFRRRLHAKNLHIRLPINPILFNVNMEEDLKYKTELGSVSYQVDKSEIVWNIDNITGNNPSIKMMAELSIDESNLDMDDIQSSLQNKLDHHEEELEDWDENEEAKRELDQYYGVNGAQTSLIQEIQKKTRKIKQFNDIKITFNIPMLSYTGLRLNFLKVEEEEMKYTCFPWIRYTTVLEPNPQTNIYKFKLGSNCFQIE